MPCKSYTQATREAKKLAALRRERGRTKKRRENNDWHRRLFGDAYTLSARFRRILKVTLLPHTIECAARLARVGKIAVTGTLIRKCNLRVQSDALPFGAGLVTLGSSERVSGDRTKSNSLDPNRVVSDFVIERCLHFVRAILMFTSTCRKGFSRKSKRHFAPASWIATSSLHHENRQELVAKSYSTTPASSLVEKDIHSRMSGRFANSSMPNA